MNGKSRPKAAPETPAKGNTSVAPEDARRTSDPRTPPYAPRRTKRTRATKTEMADRQNAILRIVASEQPTGIRFAYYTASTLGLVPKTKAGYGKVQRAILAMRRDGRLPWDWITDTNRWMHKPESYGSVDEALAEVAASYRKALWRDAAVVVEVWCESESVAGVLLPITSVYDVPLYPIKGQTSETFAYAAAQNYRSDPRPLHIYYVGDCDPHGYEIETNLHAKLVQHSGRTDINFTRLAATIDQADSMQLPGGPAKKRDYVNAMTGDHIPWPYPAVEVEALRPNFLRGIVEAAITSHIDSEALDLQRMVEANERRGLLALAHEWARA